MGQDKVFQNIRWGLIMVAMATVTAEDPLFTCDFETDMCGMEQRNNDDFDWTRNNGTTATGQNQPTGPRGAQVGIYYIYIETSEPNNNYDRAYISTPAMQHNGDICVRFYYNMYGDHIGHLTVFSEQQDENNPVWREEGDKGSAWLDGKVTVKDFTENDKVVFLGQAGNAHLGDIAIDYVRIHAGECSACQINNGGCDTLCVKLEEYPHLKCECYHGYRIESDLFKCVDIDECREGNDSCSDTCRNTPGSYQCQCPNGYSLAPNNRTCEDIDECKEGNGGCSDTCRNTPGNYVCQCPSDFSLETDNRTCKDIDECKEGNGGCSDTCRNTPGNYECQCPSDYSLETDNRTCKEITVPTASSGAAIGGGLAAGLVIIAAAILAAVFIIRKRRKRQSDDVMLPITHSQGSAGTADTPEPQASDSESLRVEIKHGADYEYATVTDKSPASPLKPIPLKPNPKVLSAKPTMAADASGIYSHATEAIYNNVSSRMIAKAHFPEYVKTQKAVTEPFKEEFKTLPDNMHQSKDAARNGLITKNRFKNILPYDHNRVLLQPIPGEDLSDYINASTIGLYNEGEAFIASLGPTKTTLDDFWRMVWEQHVAVVVILTNLVEDSVLKCEQYWPDKGSILYGHVTVQAVTEQHWPDFCIRVFSIQVGKDEPRYVKQLHYTAWPDKKVPVACSSLLRFRKRMRKNMIKDKPTLVHCSAGVGRTGTLMALDYLMNQLEAEGQLDVYGCLEKLRAQRINMVQSLIQYVFIHDALAEFIKLGDTAVNPGDFPAHATEEQIKAEYELLNDVMPVISESDRKVALSKENKTKNRDANIVPRASKRVFLTGRLKGRNDYINGVFVNSYRRRDGYIVTQTPLVGTQVDFWRMVHDRRARCVVVMDTEHNDLIPTEKEEVTTYMSYYVTLTSARQVQSGRIHISEVLVGKGDPPANRKPENEYVNNEDVSKLKGKRNSDSDVIMCRILHVAVTSYTDLTSHLTSELYQCVQEAHLLNPDVPVVVASSDGAEVSGVAIAFFSLVEMMTQEPEVDICHVIRQMKEARPEFIRDLEQYKFLYSVIGDHLQQQDG